MTRREPTPAPTPAPTQDLTPFQQQFLATMGMTSAASPGAADARRVYWGDLPQGFGTGLSAPAAGRQLRDDEVRGRQPAPGTAMYRDEDRALQAFFEWTPEQRKQWGAYLVQIGWLDEDEQHDFAKLMEAWDKSVAISAEFAKAGKHKVNPWQAAAMFTGDDRSGSTKAGRTRTYTQRQASLTTAQGARALLDEAMSRYLGRNANEEEISAFLSKLNENERANPTVTTQTITEDGDGVATSSSTQSTGGFDGGEFARTQTLDLPEYAAYQAGVTYANALFDAIRSPV